MKDELLVCVIDDDDSVRESVPALLRTYGFTVRAFETAEEFLASDAAETTKCVVVDVAMPGMSGPELFETLREGPKSVPVIFITAHIELCANLVALGAAGCLHKPFDPMALIEALERALPGT